MIIAAAIRTKTAVHSVPRPGRHSDVVQAHKERDPEVIDGERGFLDHNGRFLQRRPAAVHAFGCDQVKLASINWALGLHSEDLW